MNEGKGNTDEDDEDEKQGRRREQSVNTRMRENERKRCGKETNECKEVNAPRTTGVPPSHERPRDAKALRSRRSSNPDDDSGGDCNFV